MFSIASRFPAATITKSVGTGSVWTIAPEERSDWPVIWNSPSWIAVISFCCDRMSRVLISSTYNTPLFDLWMAPASTRSWLGVSIPPDWNGS